jgi:xylulokinase
LVLPYFEPTGAPYFVHDACGAIVGLTPDTSRGRILKGILEGETYYFVESMSLLHSLGVGTTELVASGGGARSDEWLQIKADILGLPTVRLETTEAGTLGAAIVAGAATGVYRDVRHGIETAVRRADRFRPDPDRHEAYRGWHDRYRRLYAAVEGSLKEVRAAVG